MTFRSAVDTWFYAVIVVTAVVVAAAALPALRAGNGAVVMAVGIAAVIAVGLPVWLLYSTHYTVTYEQLVIRSGPFLWRIPRSEIHEVRPTRSLLSSPALSLDRLEIRYGKGLTILVSPKDKAAFRDALGHIN